MCRREFPFLHLHLVGALVQLARVLLMFWSRPMPPSLLLKWSNYRPCLERHHKPVQSGASAPPPQKQAKHSQAADSGFLTPLQRALANSLFGGKIKINEDTTMEQFATSVKSKWTIRSVVDTLGSFLEEYGEGCQIPKTKDARIELFWKLLSELD